MSSLLELKDNGIKKLQDMSRNRNFLISDAEKTVRLLLLSQATNAESERIFSARKNIPRINLHALMLMHVHKNTLESINFADVANQFVDSRDSRKKVFGHFSQNYS